MRGDISRGTPGVGSRTFADGNSFDNISCIMEHNFNTENIILPGKILVLEKHIP